MNAGKSSPRSGRAVVLGGGMAGLLTARTLADFYRGVTVVERDWLASRGEIRRGVPQGRHVHALLARGAAALERMFPGIRRELRERGAVSGDVLGDVTWCPGGRRLKSVPCGLSVVSASRPLIESVVRDRVERLPNVATRLRTAALGLVHEGGTVRGVRVRTVGEEAKVLESDLVVDASGRSSQAPAWLEALHYPAPSEERLDVQIAYATRSFRVPAEVMRGRVAVVIARTRELPRGAVAQAIEGGKVLVSFTGYRGHEPRPDPEGLLAHARSLPYRDIEEIVSRGEPLGEIARYHVPFNLRRRYEALARFPEGFLVLGDALCAFNPLYAQGMSVAAVEALALGECLSERREGLGPRFFRSTADIVGRAWRAAAANDLEMPGVRGPRPWIGRMMNGWTRQLLAAAERDEDLSRAFVRVANLVDPPSRLLSCGALARVIRSRSKLLRGKRGPFEGEPYTVQISASTR